MTYTAGAHGTTIPSALTTRQKVFRLAMTYLALIGATLVFVIVGVNIGQNGYFDITLIGDSFVVFGGVWSFLALILFLVIAAGLYVGVFVLAENRHSHWSAIVAIGATVAAFIVGSLWIRIDLAFFGGVWPVLIYLVFLAGVTVAVAAILGYFRRN